MIPARRGRVGRCLGAEVSPERATRGATGFDFRLRLSGATPTVERFPVEDGRDLHVGDMLSLGSGQLALGASGHDPLLGAAIETSAGDDATPFISVITDADAVYAVRDNHARSEGDALDLSGASGAQSVGEGPNHDFRVVTTCSATDETLIRIGTGRHAHDRPTGGELNAAIARAVVRTYRNHMGRGPTKAQAFFRHNIIVVLLEEVMATAERNLAASGQTAAVLEVRQQLQQLMRTDLVGTVARLTGCRVTAHMSANHIDPDLAAELFVLDKPVPAGPRGSDPAVAHSSTLEPMTTVRSSGSPK